MPIIYIRIGSTITYTKAHRMSGTNYKGRTFYDRKRNVTGNLFGYAGYENGYTGYENGYAGYKNGYTGFKKPCIQY